MCGSDMAVVGVEIARGRGISVPRDERVAAEHAGARRTRLDRTMVPYGVET